MKICLSVFPWYYLPTRIQEIENQHRIQEINRNIPKIFQTAPCLMVNLCWQFHENPFNRFLAMLLTDTSPEKIPMFKGLNGTSWKCSRIFLVPSSTYTENFMKIRLAVSFFRNVAHRQTNRQTDRQTNKQTNKQTNVQRWNHNLRRSAEVIISNCMPSEVCNDVMYPFPLQRLHCWYFEMDM